MSAYVQLMVQLMSNKLTPLISHIILNEDYLNNSKLEGDRKKPFRLNSFSPAVVFPQLNGFSKPVTCDLF